MPFGGASSHGSDRERVGQVAHTLFFKLHPNTRPVLTGMWPDSGGNDTVGLDNPIHIAFLLILLLLVFGARRLPEMGRSLGDGMRGFKDALGGESHPTAVSQPVPRPVLVGQEQPTAKAARTTAASPMAEPTPPAAA
jgi:sec-independent protein translocase protein TatA